MCSSDIFLGLLAILFPPLPVWVKRGICSADSLINILLCTLGFLPGLIHAWYIIAYYPEPDHDYQSVPQDAERHTVTYVVVRDNGEQESYEVEINAPYASLPKPSGDRAAAANGQRTYGTNSSSQPAASTPQNPQQQQQQGPSTGAAAAAAGEGSSDGAAPPSYAQVVAGDNKVQTHD